MDVSAAKKLLAEAGSAVIVAATKTRAPEEINMLPALGITRAGENRVQELLAKYESVRGIEWHFIGRLQTNKVKYIVDKVKLIQSVDRSALAAEISRQCEKKDVFMDVLIELNLGEEQKGGVMPDDLFALADMIRALPRLRLKGLMCVPPACATAEHYEKAAAAYSALKDRYEGIEFFSMGMSGDYQTALRYGANMIRPGSILFGQRN